MVWPRTVSSAGGHFSACAVPYGLGALGFTVRGTDECVRPHTSKLDRSAEWFVCHLDSRALFHAARLQLAEDVVEQRPVTAPDLLELDPHAEIVDEIFHLRLQREAHVKDVQHQAEIRARTQRFHRGEARAVFGNLLYLTGHAQHAVAHLRLALNIKARPAAAIRLRPPKSARLRAPAESIENDGLILLFHLAQFVIPRRLTIDALHSKLASQRRSRIS